MNVSELRDAFRAQIDDLVAPYLVSDALFLDFLNEAESEACIRAELLRDKSSAFCTIAVTSGTAVYDLDATIFSIPHASITNTGGQVTGLVSTNDWYLDGILQTDWRNESDIPRWFIYRDSTIELVPKPNDDFTLNLDCYRTPLAKMVLDADSPEINGAYHRYLLYWVMHRAYSIPDEDIYNPKKAEQNESDFTKVFGYRPTATMRKRQRMNTPHRNKLSFIG